MLPWSGQALLAHPLTRPHALPLSPISLAILAGVAIAAVALYWPSRDEAARAEPVASHDSWTGRLAIPMWAGRMTGIAILALVLVAGRFGSPAELDNLAPALIVGLAWPGILFLAATVGPVWRWLDPWDGLARLLQGRSDDPTSEPAADVLLAVVPTVAWAWYLAAYPDGLSPRSVATALAAYTIVMVAGALAMGRVAWLSRGEVFGLLFGWLGRLPRGRLPAWQPPRGAELVLGALAGGLLFGAVRLSELWGRLNAVPGALVYASGGLLASCVTGAIFLWALARRADRIGAPGSVAAAAVPAVGSLAVALGMSRGRLFTSLQLLPSLISDPLGLGWNLFGTADLRIEEPLPGLEIAALQLLVLVAGHVAGAAVLARRAVRARTPGAVALTGSLGAAVLALSAG